MQGTVIAIIIIVATIWSSGEISRIAYGRKRSFGAGAYKVPDLDSVPEWLQWMSFCLFLIACSLLIWSAYTRLH
jgi:hypothetical protein